MTQTHEWTLILNAEPSEVGEKYSISVELGDRRKKDPGTDEAKLRLIGQELLDLGALLTGQDSLQLAIERGAAKIRERLSSADEGADPDPWIPSPLSVILEARQTGWAGLQETHDSLVERVPKLQNEPRWTLEKTQRMIDRYESVGMLPVED